jgi:transcriptional regulator with XRE-family HTH domain
MATAFSVNLRLVLKMLSMSNAGLASELQIDKSAVSRWLTGAALPSAYNLSRLSGLVAARVEGFRTLDWELAPEDLTALFEAAGSAAAAPAASSPPVQGLPIAIWDQMIGQRPMKVFSDRPGRVPARPASFCTNTA